MRTIVNSQSVFFSTGTQQLRDNRPWVVFIHGAAMDHTVWTHPARFFARHGYNVVAPDLPGHGRSDGPLLSDVESLADWLHKVLTTLQCQQPLLIGHSMGSLIALECAARQDSDTQGVALLGPSMPMPVTEVLLDAAKDNDSAAYAMANFWSHSHQGKLGANANPGVWMFGSGYRLMNQCDKDVFHTDLNVCQNARLNLDSVTCPTLVLVGESDQMTPMRAGLSLAEQLPNPQIVQLPGSGHAMLNERPNEILDALRDFVFALALNP